MIQKFAAPVRISLTVLIGILLVNSVAAQPFVARNGDLLAGFRKTGSHQANYELVVNVGNITNLEALLPGVSITISNFTSAQLSNAFSDYKNLQWSVAAAFPGVAKWAGFPSSTIWYTLARSDAQVQTQPPQRAAAGGQQQTRQAMVSVGIGASSISANLGTSNLENNFVLVREPINDPNNLTSFLADSLNPAIGDFGSTLPFSIENATSSSFSAPVRSDLYQSCPNGTVDPVTRRTSGAAYFVGYFTLDPNGTMTFTRASQSTVVVPPPAPSLSLTRSGTTTTISLSTTNAATYTLHYTNSTGLIAPVSQWPAALQTISGDGSVKSFTDISADADRVYRVEAH
jgi:hypothetical protein